MGILLSGSLRHVQGHAARLIELHHRDVGAGAAVFPLPVGPAVGDFHFVAFDELLAHVGKKGPGKGRQALRYDEARHGAALAEGGPDAAQLAGPALPLGVGNPRRRLVQIDCTFLLPAAAFHLPPMGEYVGNGRLKAVDLQDAPRQGAGLILRHGRQHVLQDAHSSSHPRRIPRFAEALYQRID